MDTDGASLDSEGTEGNLHLLQSRRVITNQLLDSPYDLLAYIERATVHSELGYPDLAAGDAYRALLLCDECANEGFEYHDQAVGTLQERCVDSLEGIPDVLRSKIGGESGITKGHVLDRGVANLKIRENAIDDNDPNSEILQLASIKCYRILAISLLLCGCLKSAYSFCTRGLNLVEGDEELRQTKEYIQNLAKRRLKVEEVDINELPDQGLVRREGERTSKRARQEFWRLTEVSVSME
jgi:hypothetical protein